MTTEEKDKVSAQNQIPIHKDKLKEEHKGELMAATEAYEQRCLLSFSTNRSGEVIKKYDFPTLPPYDESQKEDRMVHMMNQTIGQAFMNHAPIMANSVHNAVLKTLQDRGMLGFVGPAYQQLVRWFSPLLERLLKHHRLTLRLRQMRILGIHSRLVLQHRLSFLLCTPVLHQWLHMHRGTT